VNAEAVGLYSVGVSLSEGLWLLANSVAVVLVPKLAASDAEYASRTAPLVCRNTLLVTGLGAVVLGAVSPIVVPLLFGRSFDGAIAPLLWLLPGIVALAGTKVLSAYVFSRGRPLINTWISLVALVVTLGGDLVLIPLFEVPGAAIASSLAYILSFVLTLQAYRRLSGRPFSDALVPRSSDIGLFLEGVRTALSRLKGPSPPGAQATIGSGS
jgi:O-antigen/teichoic acid export membrane protein